ncbi:hypothetical protein AB0E62_21195 [Streptomyces sp. NPDC038707]|uniref:hypothetical protein n=1 Tax=unclassified Streptomyces TaxID=2593676 RepID=UPI0033FABE1A
MRSPYVPHRVPATAQAIPFFPGNAHCYQGTPLAHPTPPSPPAGMPDGARDAGHLTVVRRVRAR